MPRTARAAAGGIIYHVLYRGNGRMGIFRKPGDYWAFVGFHIDAKERADVELFGSFLGRPRAGDVRNVPWATVPAKAWRG